MNETIELVIGYVRSAWRFRWWAVLCAWVVLLFGWIAVALLPDVYEASARVYVDTSSDLQSLLGEQIVESNVEDQLALVRQALIGRAQLREVASKTGLDSEVEKEEERTRLVDHLSHEIVLEGGTIDHRGRRDNLYSITYQHSDRAMAVNVVETLLDTFVEGSLGAKRTSSETAGKFLKEQIEEYEQRLQRAEEQLAEFRRQHFDRLPSMQGGYFERLQAATEALDDTRQQLRLAESRLERIDQQIRGEAPRITGSGEVDPESLEGRILANQRQLDQLLLRFTDSHPDVVATREILQQLERQRSEAADQIREGVTVSGGANNPVFQALQISRHEIETEIASLEAESMERERRVVHLRGLIDEMPAVEAELARLNRDYDVINAHYQSLLNSLEREQLSREVFQTEQIDFRVIDPPAVGLDPVAPKRAVLMLLSFFAAIGGGAALAVLLSQLKPVFYSASDLQLSFHMPIVGTVGRCFWEEDSRMRRREYVRFGTSLALMLVAFIGVFLFEAFGPGLRGMVL